MKKLSFYLLIFFLVSGLGYSIFDLSFSNLRLNSELNNLQAQVNALESHKTQPQNQIKSQAALETKVQALNSENQRVSQALDQSLKSLAAARSMTVKNTPSQEELVTNAVAKISPAVVSVDVYQTDSSGLFKVQVGSGSGFIISARGYVVTNKHVASDPNDSYAVALADGTQKEARLIYVDPNSDLAILKLQGVYPAVALGDSSSLETGQTVIAIGNALGELTNTVSVGTISGLHRNVIASDPYMTESLNNLIQLDASINPGNSGGPLVDLDGKVIGITVAKAQSSDNIGFAIPIDDVRAVLNGFTQ